MADFPVGTLLRCVTRNGPCIVSLDAPPNGDPSVHERETIPHGQQAQIVKVHGDGIDAPRCQLAHPSGRCSTWYHLKGDWEPDPDQPMTPELAVAVVRWRLGEVVNG